MTGEPPKSDLKKLSPLPFRTFWFGLMLFAWWVVSIELPWRNLSAIITQRGVDRLYHPITIWAYRLSDVWARYRWVAVVIIIASMFLHYFFWTRFPRYDAYGKWLFKAVFFILYVILYGFFLIMFLGAELPIWQGL